MTNQGTFCLTRLICGDLWHRISRVTAERKTCAMLCLKSVQHDCSLPYAVLLQDSTVQYTSLSPADKVKIFNSRTSHGNLLWLYPVGTICSSFLWNVYFYMINLDFCSIWPNCWMSFQASVSFLIIMPPSKSLKGKKNVGIPSTVSKPEPLQQGPAARNSHFFQAQWRFWQPRLLLPDLLMISVVNFLGRTCWFWFTFQQHFACTKEDIFQDCKSPLKKQKKKLPLFGILFASVLNFSPLCFVWLILIFFGLTFKLSLQI